MFCLTEVRGQADCDACGCQLHEGDKAHVENQDDGSVIWLCQPCFPQVMESRYVLVLPEPHPSNS
jgi:hypothetical protein